MQIQSATSATAPQAPTPDVMVAVARTGPAQAKNATAAPTVQRVEEAISEANKSLKAIDSNLQFAVDPETKMTVIKVVDTSSNTVLRQIPAQEMLDIAHALESMKGVLLRQEA